MKIISVRHSFWWNSIAMGINHPRLQIATGIKPKSNRTESLLLVEPENCKSVNRTVAVRVLFPFLDFLGIMYCFIMRLSCSPALRHIFHIPMAQY